MRTMDLTTPQLQLLQSLQKDILLVRTINSKVSTSSPFLLFDPVGENYLKKLNKKTVQVLIQTRCIKLDERNTKNLEPEIRAYLITDIGKKAIQKSGINIYDL